MKLQTEYNLKGVIPDQDLSTVYCRFYKMNAGQSETSDMFKLSEFGYGLKEMHDDLNAQSWWRPEGGYMVRDIAKKF